MLLELNLYIQPDLIDSSPVFTQHDCVTRALEVTGNSPVCVCEGGRKRRNGRRGGREGEEGGREGGRERRERGREGMREGGRERREELSILCTDSYFHLLL